MSKINLLAKEGDLPGNPFCQFSFPRLELLTEVLVLRGRGGEKECARGGGCEKEGGKNVGKVVWEGGG